MGGTWLCSIQSRIYGNPRRHIWPTTSASLCQKPFHKMVAMQACSWTAECSVSGCAKKCIVNRERVNNYYTINDRAWDTEYWELCPELALIVNASLPTTSSRRRSRRLAQVRVAMGIRVGIGFTADTAHGVAYERGNGAF
jgi:hypothetical protein